jgi:hypothetical protein
MKFAPCVATLFLLACLPARAHDVETDPIAICDTLKRMERFTQLLDEEPTVAMSAVNARKMIRNPALSTSPTCRVIGSA